MTPASTRTFLLTGATGFLGKVLLEELLRRRTEIGVSHVFVLIRPLRGLSAQTRFTREVVASECFANLPDDWTRHVTVVEGNVEHAGLGMRDESVSQLQRVTHVVHAAASVQFDLPVALAARANVTASLNALDVARSLPRLERFVYVSTAYVTPARGGAPIVEERVPLPVTAATLYEDCLRGDTSDQELLARTGHPNTYTFTKALAEHLLLERRGHVPVSIVRPSVITASRAYPFPGWIDSAAGFAAFVMLLGTGHLRAVVCDPEARLDLIPVDEVSQRIIRAGLGDEDGEVIRHAVAGTAQSPTMAHCWDATQRYFRVQRVELPPRGRYLGQRGVRFMIADLVQHRLPVVVAGFQSKARKRQAQKRAVRISYLNDQFAYFTTQTFDFRSSVPLDAAFDGGKFVETVDRGVYRYLLKRDDRRWLLAGQRHGGHRGDVRWAVGQPRGNAWIRCASWLSTKLFRRAIGSVTVDVPSFERARAEAGDATMVLTPSHRSYLDFVLCSYLAFARPDLLPIPHIAATMEFARIPILGRMLRAMHAFYLRRGHGKDPELASRVRALLDSGSTLAFFIEGARSRSGEFLAPKRGLLRCIQATGRRCALLPIAITYERVPEQAAFDRELAGHPRDTMRLAGLLKWAYSAWRGRVDLGRVHIACGAPVIIDPSSDVHAASLEVIEQLRGAMLRPSRTRAVVAVPDGETWSPPVPVAVLAGAHSAQ
ncbi:MAG: SDR family oxidoreductase [bacterium]